MENTTTPKEPSLDDFIEWSKTKGPASLKESDKFLFFGEDSCGDGYTITSISNLVERYKASLV